MKSISDKPAPAPTSSLEPEKRALKIGGGPNHLVNTRHGGFLANEYDFYLGNALIRYGEYGELEWHLLQQLIPAGKTVVEVGANIGCHTVPMAKLVGLKGRVIAIEPQRIIHQYLCANISLNALPNVETHQCGCGERIGIMAVPRMDYFSPIRNNFGGIALVPESEGEPVAIRTLDDIIGDRAVQLIKIDVEGMEAQVLRGAKRTIRKSRPFLYVENDRIEKSEEIILLLRRYGYKLYWHTPPLYNPTNFFEQTENIYGLTRAINMFCVPDHAVMDMRHFQEVVDAREHPLRPFK